MKKWLLLSILLLLPACFSCYSSAVTIQAENNLETVYAMLLIESRYNFFDDDMSFSYYALNDSSAKIKINESSIIIQSFNESTDWGNLLKNELYELWSYNATSLSEEDIIFLSIKGCCGNYENGIFTEDSNECGNEIIIPLKDDSGKLAIYLSIIPFLIILGYFARTDYRKHLAFALGALGWFAAFVLRLPLLEMIPLAWGFWAMLLIPSLLAGLFEESVR
ncbi:MAG: hypothetical protein PHG04_03850, partial [Candidatus Nanoarchaeia archaeon]|nr:hypothetical protein [Candidatus Nanoarchaeia archaeon]